MDAPCEPGLLRLIACGSVDDGKSTLIGRLLWEGGSVPRDQLAALERDSRRYGTTGEAPDLALLVDGLQAEREQGITIDVAHRTLTTRTRRLAIADAPGHEQYTRNMATAASTADVAVVLVDATRGVLAQTRRHLLIASLMGIRHVVLAVNKMDLAGFSQAAFDAIVAQCAAAVAGHGFATSAAIPIAARDGDNVASPGARMPWHEGPTLLGHLETLDLGTAGAERPFRMPVQWVSRLPEGRLYAGTIGSGTLRLGDSVVASDTERPARIARLLVAGRPAGEASAGQAVMLGLDGEHDVSRGTVLSAASVPVAVADQFQAHMLWLHEAPLQPGRSYLVKLGTTTLGGSVTRIRHRVDLETGGHLSADTLAMNEVGVVNLSVSSPLGFEPYRDSRALGGFIVIDRQDSATIGVGMIDFALRRSTNLGWHETTVDRAARAAIKGQRPLVLWFTGLSGAGKSTIADLVERRLHAEGRHTVMLDGDNVRHGLNRDLGFTEADRVENIRRVSEVAALMADAGLIVLVSFISPYRAEREAARDRLPPGEFLEVFVDTSLQECRRRDPKGLYRKADAGTLRNLTGVDAPYEPPQSPDIHLRTADGDPETMAEQVVRAMGLALVR